MKIWEKISLLLVLIATICCVFSTFDITSFAKYYVHLDSSKIQTSQNFYFESNRINNSSSVTFFGNGEHTVDIDVKNYADELRITPSNITYTISSSANDTYTNYSIENGGQVITGGELTGGSEDSDNISIVCGTGYDGNTILTININATLPYTKTITLTIRFSPTTATYLIEDAVGSVNAVLKVMSLVDIASDVITLQWDNSKVNVDMTSSAFINATTKTTNESGYYLIKFNNILANSVLTINFFKEDLSQNFTVNEITIQNNLIEIS